MVGLNALVTANVWSRVVPLTAKLCRNATAVRNDKLDLLFQYRFEALFRMKMYDDLLHEASNILTEEETRLQHNSSDDKIPIEWKQHNLSFSLRLLIVEVKLMTGRSQEVRSIPPHHPFCSMLT